MSTHTGAGGIINPTSARRGLTLTSSKESKCFSSTSDLSLSLSLSLSLAIAHPQCSLSLCISPSQNLLEYAICLFDGTFGELGQVKSGTGDLMKADD